MCIPVASGAASQEGTWLDWWIIGNGEWFAIAQIQARSLLAIERPRAATPKHRNLVPALIHRAIAIDSL